MSITLSDATWTALCDEYLHGEHEQTDEQAEVNAHRLAQYLDSQVVHLSGDAFKYLDVAWRPVDNPEPYDGLGELSEAFTQFYRCGANVLVSDCYHDHPVFSRVTNLQFRIWHDTGHYLRQKGFDRSGELELFVIQAQTFGSTWHRDHGSDKRSLVDALFSESVYQLAASVVLGTFPDQQYVRTPGPVGRALLDAWGL